MNVYDSGSIKVQVLQNAYSYLGIAGTITTVVGLLALIVLASFGIALQHVKAQENTFREAIRSKNEDVVNAFLTRFSIDRTKLSEDTSYRLAVEQIRAEKTKVLTRYVLIFLTIAGFLLLVAVLFSGQSKASPRDPLKMIYVLGQIHPPERRVAVYAVYCECEPTAEVKEILISLNLSVSTKAASPKIISSVESASSRTDIEKSLDQFDAVACGGNLKFEIRDGFVFCKNGEQIPYLSASAKGTKLVSLEAIVFHHTAASSFRGVLQWLRATEANASLHLLVSRSGAIVQLVRLDEQAWHAGRGKWRNFAGMNKHSIGISFDNVGHVTQADRAGAICTSDGSCWQRYTDRQIQIARGLVRAIYKGFRKVPLLVHSDIGSTACPGPAFLIEALRMEFVTELL